MDGHYDIRISPKNGRLFFFAVLGLVVFKEGGVITTPLDLFVRLAAY